MARTRQFQALEAAIVEYCPDDDALLGLWYLDRLPAGDEALAAVNAAFTEHVRTLVLAKLQAQVSQDTEAVRSLAREIRAVNSPEWTP
jgi:hypothetical protein